MRLAMSRLGVWQSRRAASRRIRGAGRQTRGSCGAAGREAQRWSREVQLGPPVRRARQRPNAGGRDRRGRSGVAARTDFQKGLALGLSSTMRGASFITRPPCGRVGPQIALSRALCRAPLPCSPWRPLRTRQKTAPEPSPLFVGCRPREKQTGAASNPRRPRFMNAHSARQQQFEDDLRHTYMDRSVSHESNHLCGLDAARQSCRVCCRFAADALSMFGRGRLSCVTAGPPYRSS
jgi:hypothetical protein